jgi:hypothetical protein
MKITTAVVTEIAEVNKENGHVRWITSKQLHHSSPGYEPWFVVNINNNDENKSNFITVFVFDGDTKVREVTNITTDDRPSEQVSFSLNWIEEADLVFMRRAVREWLDGPQGETSC